MESKPLAIPNAAPLARLKKGVIQQLRRMGYELYRPASPAGAGYEFLRPLATWAPWTQDREFVRTYDAIEPATKVDRYRCYELWTLIEQSAKLEGAILEVGVWRGGTGVLMAKQAARCGIAEPIYLADTFTGVVKAGAKDSLYKGGEHGDATRAGVEDLARAVGVSNTRILEGMFPEETAHLVQESKFRLCHIDVDVYQSARDVSEWVWPRLPIGGLVVYDDYGFHGCDGVTRCVDEQRALADRVVIYNLNGHGVVVKIR